jgi:endoglycosylceramidase
MPRARKQWRRLRSPLLVAVAVLGAGGLLSACSGGTPTGVVRQYSPPSSRVHPARVPDADLVSGRLSAPGGPYLYDRGGRAVFLHGVNAVYKVPPYLLTPAPGRPWNFTSTDAEAISRLGFDVVRLGITWGGLEPGTGGPNQPRICTPGTPSDPHEFSATVARNYLRAVARTVGLLGRQHVYTLLDMHQDVYNEAFRGEGAPDWAVCTAPLPVVALGGRWSNNYSNPSLGVAVRHFWSNDVVGDLQGEYDRVWAFVAHYFRNNPWVVGYDVYNEPYDPELVVSDTRHFASLLQCFYTGRDHPGTLADSGDRLVCPPTVPARGAIPSIEAADHHHLVFVEPDIYSARRGGPSLLGPMPFPRLVLAFHSYCPQRSPLTGDPTDVGACAAHTGRAIDYRFRERPRMANTHQPGGPAWVMGEFGATQTPALVTAVTGAAARFSLGWIYWAWKFYDDPTGSTDEALIDADGTPAPTLPVLAQTYAQAVAGRPLSIAADPVNGGFSLTYRPTQASGPTVIAVPSVGHYPAGYCSRVDGGRIVSPPGASHLLVTNDPGALTVSINITDGRCGKPAPPPPAASPVVPTTTPASPATATPPAPPAPPTTATPPTTVPALAAGRHRSPPAPERGSTLRT